MTAIETAPMYVSKAQISRDLYSGAWPIGGPGYRIMANHRFAVEDNIRIPEADIITGFKPGPTDEGYDNPPLSAFEVGSMLVVEAEIAKVLSVQNLGRTTLHPIECVDDREGIYSGKSFYFVNLSEVHSFIVPLKEHGFERTPNNILQQTRPCIGDPPPVEYSGQALPAIWRDKMMSGSLFFSKDCGDALINAGYEKAFDLVKCRSALPEEITNAI